MVDDLELWGTESGFLSDYMGTVKEAYFGVNAKYNPNATLLTLVMETDDDMMPEVEEQYSLGEGWKTYDGGETVEHPDQVKNARKKINANSQYGKFQDKIKHLGALDDIAQNAIRNNIKGGPFNSRSWVGAQFHMREVENKYTDRQTKEEKVSRKNYPDEWLGFAEAGTAVAGRNRSQGGESAPAAARGTSAGSGPDRATLGNLAVQFSHERWVDEVMGLPGALQDPGLISQLTDPEGLYKSVKDEVESGTTGATDPT